MGGGIAGVLNYEDQMDSGGKELVMIDVYPGASESFGRKRYIEIELMTHLHFGLVPPVRRYLPSAVREPPTGRSEPRIRAGHPIHLLPLVNRRP